MSDLRFFKKNAGKRPETQIINQIRGKAELKISGMAVGPLWRAAAPGLKPLRLPRARNEASSCPGIFSSNMSTLWRREEFLGTCSKEELAEKAQDIEVTIPVKKSQEARYNLDPGPFFVNRFWEATRWGRNQ